MANRSVVNQKRGLYREYLQTENPILCMPQRTRYRYESAIKAARRGMIIML